MRHAPSRPLAPAGCLLVAPLLLILNGCADEAKSARRAARAEPGQIISADQFDAMPSASEPAAVALAPMAPVSRQMKGPAEQGEPAPVPARTATAGRKIIYNANVDLVTEDLPKLEIGLRGLVGSSGGYIADSNRAGAAGSTRSGTWKIRVPVDNFDALLRGVSGLGELVSTRSNSEDVSAEFFDLEARQTAKKVEEARLLKHLSDSTGRLEEILAVERELSRVRSEIEQMQGRLAVLGNLTTLATITVAASEIRGYVPPNPPTLSQRVGRTFGASVGNLQNFGEGLLLIIVALAPWLPVIAGAGLVVFLIGRFCRRWLAKEWREIVGSYRAAVAARSARG